jgi:capsular exopolysaccharide synthesis family protein
MSRIEEALRRAAVLGPGGGAPGVARPVSTDGAPLARFPAEDRAEAGHTSRADVVSPRTIAAPRVGSGGHLGELAEALEGKLVLSAAASPVAVEQYRRLAGVLHELQITHGTRTLMVSSAVPSEGKTLTITNLALTLSESYHRRVLLIDADLRRPSLHEIFRLPNATGLSDGLRAGGAALSVLEVSSHLSVLPAGRAESNPMAGLTSERMRTFLEESAAVFDWVLLDAPPVGIMPDANLLARLTHGVIFVIAAGATPYTLVERAVTEIGRDHIVGTVLNRVEESAIPATGYYEYYQPRAQP